jgi:hypothetical protein
MDTLMIQKKKAGGVLPKIYDIWELDYGARLQIPIFKCQWVKHPNGVSVDNYMLTLVDLKNVGHKDDPWVLADRVTQVFYILQK